jgi:hypothetical protein
MTGACSIHDLCTADLERNRVLAFLRSCGPAFDHEIVREGLSKVPQERIAELVADGYRIEILKAHRSVRFGPCATWELYVLRLKHPQSGEVIAAPPPVGSCAMLERW